MAKKGHIPWNKNKEWPEMKGNTYGFKKGFTPWNKGIKTGIVPKNAFKKGHIPWIKGKSNKWGHHTKEVKEKIRQVHLGKKKTKEAIEKNRQAHLGKICTEETKKKMRKTAKERGTGKWFKGRFGKNSNAWKGGIRKIDNERNDSKYQWWVEQVKKRDNNQCLFKGQDCSGYNIVHHILSWRDYPELRYEIKNGITLCQHHHPRKREDEQRLILTFQELIGSKEVF